MLKYRPVTEADREKLAEWIAADSDHKDKSDPDFWLKPEDGINLFVVQDEQDDVMFFRAESLLRLHIQFCPDSERNKAAIKECLPQMAANSKNKYRQIIFESIYKPLIRFLKNRGFRSSPNEYVYDLHVAEKTGV